MFTILQIFKESSYQKQLQIKQLIYTKESKFEIFINADRNKYKFITLCLKMSSFKKPFLSHAVIYYACSSLKKKKEKYNLNTSRENV